MNTKGTFTVLPIVAVLIVGAVLATLYFVNVKNGRPWLSLSWLDAQQHASIDAAIITLPPPPADNSADTKAEIAVLLEDKHARATEIIAAVQREAMFDAVQIGPHTVGEYMAGDTLPELASALSYSLPEVERVLAIKQKELNRTRPSEVDAKIEPIAAVPSHPSYPADYASKARFVAYVLSYIDPAHEADYLSYSEEVAKRQEIAGIQYPLDNAVGAIFAGKAFELLLKDTDFVARLDKAKAEWEAAGVSKEEPMPTPTE